MSTQILPIESTQPDNRLTHKSGIKIERHERISKLMLKGNSLNKITKILADQNFINPQTKKPYSLTTIASDAKEIHTEYKKRAYSNYSQHVAEKLAKLELLEYEGWRIKDYELILKSIDRQIKLLGLNAPEVILNIDWRMQITQLLESGDITESQLKDELGEDMYTNIIEGNFK